MSLGISRLSVRPLASVRMFHKVDVYDADNNAGTILDTTYGIDIAPQHDSWNTSHPDSNGMRQFGRIISANQSMILTILSNKI